MGFSNGGMFAYTLWCMRPEKFAAFCCSGACITSSDLRLKTPKPAFITISGNDPIVPTAPQEQALQLAEATDRSHKDGANYGESGTYMAGTKPIVVWRYNGGHEFPFRKLSEADRVL